MYDKDELTAAINKLLSSKMSEEQQISHVVEMSNNILDPEWMDYIFQSNQFFDQNGNLDVDAVCAKILSHRSIIL